MLQKETLVTFLKETFASGNLPTEYVGNAKGSGGLRLMAPGPLSSWEEQVRYFLSRPTVMALVRAEKELGAAALPTGADDGVRAFFQPHAI